MPGCELKCRVDAEWLDHAWHRHHWRYAHFVPLQLNRLVAPAPIARSVDWRPLQLWLRQRSSMWPVDWRTLQFWLHRPSDMRPVNRRPLQLWLHWRSSMRPVDPRCRRVQLNLRLKHGRCARMLRTLRLGWTHRLGPINGRSRGPLYSSWPEDWRRTLYGGSARDALQERLHRHRQARTFTRPAQKRGLYGTCDSPIRSSHAASPKGRRRSRRSRRNASAPGVGAQCRPVLLVR
jgi:hypothetical protein